MGSSTTVSKTELPEKTETEKEMDAKILAIFDSYMDESGYDVEQNLKTVYENPERVSSLDGRISDLESKIVDAQAKGLNQNQINDFTKQKDSLQKELDKEKEKFTTEYDYDYVLNDTGKKIQDIREKSLDYQAEAQEMFHETFKKFAGGDYSITVEQELLIQDQIGLMKDPIMAVLDEVQKQYETTGTNMGVALNEYMTAITDTGLSVEAALSTVEDRIKNTKEGVSAGIGEEEKRIGETGLSVKAALTGVRDEIKQTGDETRSALEDTFKLKRLLIEKDMKDLYDQQRVATAEKASRLGRSPTDPRFQLEMQNNLQKNIERAQLQLSIEESGALAGLVERTGQRREQLGLTEAQLEETTGQRLETAARQRTAAEEAAGLREEQIAGERAGLAERTGQRTEAATAEKMRIAERTGAGLEQTALQKAGVEESVQQMGQGMRSQFGVGLPASQIGLGIDVAGYNQAIRQQQLANTQSAIGTGQAVAQPYQAERMAQPTTTTKTTPSIGGMILGGIGTLTGGAGSIFKGMGGLK